MKSNRKKSIGLTFRGFSPSTQEAGLLFPIPASGQGSKGDLVRPWSKTKFSRSFLQFELLFEDDADPNDMLEALFKHVGGLETINQANHIIKPEYCEINIYLPSKTSKLIQDCSLSTNIISQVESIKATLGFNFF